MSFKYTGRTRFLFFLCGCSVQWNCIGLSVVNIKHHIRIARIQIPAWVNHLIWYLILPSTGADPGFPVGGGANPPRGGGRLGGGLQHKFFPKFPKNYEIEKIFGRRGATDALP